MSKSPAIVNFRVPNNATGRHWIDLARDYLNRDRFGELAARPRGPRNGHPGGTKRSDAVFLGVYLRERREWSGVNAEWRAIQELSRIWHARLSVAQGERMKQEARAERAENGWRENLANGIDESARADKAEKSLRRWFWIALVASSTAAGALGIIAAALWS